MKPAEEKLIKTIQKLNNSSCSVYDENLFDSYRFIDYLLSVTNNAKVVAELQAQRKKCSLPTWMEEAKMEFKK